MFADGCCFVSFVKVGRAVRVPAEGITGIGEACFSAWGANQEKVVNQTGKLQTVNWCNAGVPEHYAYLPKSEIKVERLAADATTR